jgi:dUTP pyrophosphatase
MSQSDSEEEVYLYELEKDLLHQYDSVMKLKIFVDSTDDELKNKYTQAIYNHHLKLQNNIHHIDAGFDLFAPKDVIMYDYKANLIDYDIICSATILKQMHDHRKEINTGFYMYPRSSISKTPIRLANNVGIIDAGYRGHLMGMFDCLMSNAIIRINKFDRHLQICAPGLIPIMVTMVSTKEQLGEKTARGEGGFGSTGK